MPPHKDSPDVQWIKDLAQQGDAEGQYALGLCYDTGTGQGISRNKDEAAKWFHKSAAQEFSEAEYKLGNYYEYGDLPEDYILAAEWYCKAAKHGHAEAQEKISKWTHIAAAMKTIPFSIPENLEIKGANL